MTTTAEDATLRGLVRELIKMVLTPTHGSGTSLFGLKGLHAALHEVLDTLDDSLAIECRGKRPVRLDNRPAAPFKATIQMWETMAKIVREHTRGQPWGERVSFERAKLLIAAMHNIVDDEFARHGYAHFKDERSDRLRDVEKAMTDASLIYGGDRVQALCAPGGAVLGGPTVGTAHRSPGAAPYVDSGSAPPGGGDVAYHSASAAPPDLVASLVGADSTLSDSRNVAAYRTGSVRLSAVSRLSLEITGGIITFLPSFKDRTAASSVSRVWRRGALAEASLWSDFGTLTANGVANLLELLRRSGSEPLQLVIDFSVVRQAEDIACLLSELWRVRRLGVRCLAAPTTHERIAKHVLGSPYLRPRVLHLDVDFQVLPVLQSLAVTQDCFPAPWGPSVTTLEAAPSLIPRVPSDSSLLSNLVSSIKDFRAVRPVADDTQSGKCHTLAYIVNAFHRLECLTIRSLLRDTCYVSLPPSVRAIFVEQGVVEGSEKEWQSDLADQTYKNVLGAQQVTFRRPVNNAVTYFRREAVAPRDATLLCDGSFYHARVRQDDGREVTFERMATYMVPILWATSLLSTITRVTLSEYLQPNLWEMVFSITLPKLVTLEVYIGLMTSGNMLLSSILDVDTSHPRRWNGLLALKSLVISSGSPLPEMLAPLGNYQTISKVRVLAFVSFTLNNPLLDVIYNGVEAV